MMITRGALALAGVVDGFELQLACAELMRVFQRKIVVAEF